MTIPVSDPAHTTECLNPSFPGKIIYTADKYIYAMDENTQEKTLWATDGGPIFVMDFSLDQEYIVTGQNLGGVSIFKKVHPSTTDE